MNRRRFIASSCLTLGSLLALPACGGGSGGSGGASSPTTPADPTPPPPVATESDTKRLVLWGDSRTEGAGDSKPYIFPSFLSQFLSTVAVDDEGIGGQNAAEVVARQGGAPTLLTLAGNAIPAQGPVDVVSASVEIFRHPSNGVASGSFAGTLAGVAGVYATDGTDQTFTRSTQGAAVSAPAGTPFLTSTGEASRDATMFLCVGENGVANDDPANIVNFTTLAVGHLTPDVKHYIVAAVMPDLSATNGTPARQRYDALNALLSATHGTSYLDLASPPTAAEMTATGYVPGADDQADISAGVYPRGMFADGGVHLLRSGQMIWAGRVRDFYKAKGWA